MRTAAEFRDIVIKSSNGNFVRLSDVADDRGLRPQRRSIAWFNKQPAVLIQITKQGDANVIDTVDRVKALIPELKQWIPAGVDISTLVDRTGTIRASVQDMQWTLLATAFLVMVVVFVFLRRITPTIAAGVSVPLALAGTCAGMWLAGFSIDNLSLMALAISVGFVVDDAIVMIENMYRNLEHGMRAAPGGAGGRAADRLHGAVDQPVADRGLHAADLHGRHRRPPAARILADADLRDRGLDRGVADGHADDLRPLHQADDVRIARPGSTGSSKVRCRASSRSTRARLRTVLDFPLLTLLVFFATIALTVTLYIKTPKGYFPTDDSGFVIGATRASADISFQSMLEPAAAARRYRDGRSGRGRHRLDASAAAAGPGGGDLQPRHHVHQPEAAGGARPRLDPGRDRPSAASLCTRCPASACSCSPRRTSAPADGRAIPTTSTRCPAPTSTCCRNGRRSSPSAWRRVEGITDISSDRDPGGLQLTLVDRPPEGLGARRPGPGHRQRAQQRILAAADLDHLHPAQPVHGRAGDRPEIPGRPVQPRTHLCRRRRRRAGAAVGRGALRARPVAARGVSFAVVPLDHGVVQPAARRAAGGRHAEHPARGRGAAHAGGHSRQLRRQCRRFRQDQRPAAAPDPRRAGGDVYRARRAL